MDDRRRVLIFGAIAIAALVLVLRASKPNEAAEPLAPIDAAGDAEPGKIELWADDERKTKVVKLYERALDEFVRRDYAAAERTYRDILVLEPELPHGHYGLGSALYEQEKYDDARVAYQHALDRDHQSVPALCGLGLCSVKARETERADDYFDRLLRLKPNDVCGLVGKIETRVSLGRCAEAHDFGRQLRSLTGDAAQIAGDLEKATTLLASCRDSGSR